MHRYPIGRRRVIRDIENVLLTVVERRRLGRLLREHLFLFLGVGDEMEIARRDLAAEIIAVDSLGDAEVHADARLAGEVRPAGAVNVFLGEEASAAWLRLDLEAFLTE